jgi:hypothetical protein
MRKLSISVPLAMVLMLGMSTLVAWADSDNDVTPSSSQLFRQSTRRPKCERKSIPMMGSVTSVTMNLRVKSRHRPKLRGSHL